MNEVVISPGRKLLISTGIALLVASVLLVSVVLPAEYGIDPTGIGAGLGIRGMSMPANDDVDAALTDAAAAPATLPLAPPVSTLNAVRKQNTPYRNDQLSLTLAPGEGAEIKALMRTGEHFVFTWEVEGGAVNFDMHGEQVGAKNDEFTSYWKGRETQNGYGAFTAPFDGTHGWYWRNRGMQSVVVTVKTSGFYEKLFRP